MTYPGLSKTREYGSACHDQGIAMNAKSHENDEKKGNDENHDSHQSHSSHEQRPQQ